MCRHVQEKHHEHLGEYLERFWKRWDASSESDRVKWMLEGRMEGGQDTPQNFSAIGTYMFPEDAQSGYL
jgi:hypothetical protein